MLPFSPCFVRAGEGSCCRTLKIENCIYRNNGDDSASVTLGVYAVGRHRQVTYYCVVLIVFVSLSRSTRVWCGEVPVELDVLPVSVDSRTSTSAPLTPGYLKPKPSNYTEVIMGVPYLC